MAITSTSQPHVEITPASPFLTGYRAPIQMECDASHLPISGKIPEGLKGTLYCNGPNPQFAPGEDYHWFSGDGMIHEFSLDGKNASYRNRWVRTPKWVAENEADGRLQSFPAIWGTQAPTADGVHSTVANTAVLWHGSRLLALEERHAPYEIDPATLKSKGYFTFGGKLKGPMTGHPKIDPTSGELLFFGYSVNSPFSSDLLLHVADRDGNLLRSVEVMAPYSSVVHSFTVTQNYIIIPILPLTGSQERLDEGQPPYAWEPDKPSYLGVMPRNGNGSDIRWFTGPACYVFHEMNGHDTESGEIVIEVIKYEAPPLFPATDGGPVADQIPSGQLVRWTIAPEGSSDHYTEQVLDEGNGEWPVIDARVETLPYRHGWYCNRPVHESMKGGGTNSGLAHVDHSTGQIRHYVPPVGDHCSEPHFVQRSDDAEEGDGWLLSVIYRGNENRSDLAIFNATEIQSGPIALVHLSHRVPFCFHRDWRPAVEVCNDSERTSSGMRRQ